MNIDPLLLLLMLLYFDTLPPGKFKREGCSDRGDEEASFREAGSDIKIGAGPW